jgi:hypothetical protein
MTNNKTSIFTYLGIFLFLTGISYYLFSRFLPLGSSATFKTPTGKKANTPTAAVKKTGVLTFEGPKTEVCPINGSFHTVEEKNIWSQRRPLTVMIENHSDARPQSGLQNADVVYETVAEGGITRFMGIFYCGAVQGATNKYDVGPVRSARTYFLDLASEYSDYPLYTHVGGANCSSATPGGPCTTAKKAQAIEQIQQYGWNNKGTWGDLSQFSLSYQVCRREPDRTGIEKATEHTMFCSTKELWNTAANRGLTNVTEINKTNWDKNFRPWSFKQKDQSGAPNSKFTFDFWSGYKDYSVTWSYDQSSNSYVRSNGGQPHIDFNTGKALTAKNVLIQYAKETRAVDTHGHLLYEVIGSGKGILFQNGVKTDINWSKSSRLARTIFKDTSGKEINFIPGNIWIEILPIGNSLSYEN